MSRERSQRIKLGHSLVARVLHQRLLPSKNTRADLRSNRRADQYRCAVPDRNERNRIAPAVERVSGCTNSSRDNPGDAAAELQTGRCALTERVDHRCQWDRRKEHYEKEAS